MQSRLTLRRSPTRLAAPLIGLFAALALGGSLGYTLKPATVTSSTPHVVVAPEVVAAATDPPCVTTHHVRAC